MAYNPFYNIENPELLGYEYAWVDKESRCDEEAVGRLLSELNHPLILERVELLDMNKVSLSYNRFSQSWTLEYKSIIGSTNWILIPPVMQLIKYKPEEVVRTLEFFELVFEAVDRAREQTLSGSRKEQLQ